MNDLIQTVTIPPPKICQECGKSLAKYQSKYCGRPCRIEAFKKSKRIPKDRQKQRGATRGIARRFESWMMHWGKAGVQFYTVAEPKDMTAMAAHRGRTISTRVVLMVDQAENRVEKITRVTLL